MRGGLTYLRWLLAYYQGEVALAAAAYNAGEATVDRYRGVPPYPETRDYVKRVLRLFRKERHPYDPRVVAPSPMLALPGRRARSHDRRAASPRDRSLWLHAVCVAARSCASPRAAVRSRPTGDDRARQGRSIVAIGTFDRTRSPQFQFRGTGFVVGDGTTDRHQRACAAAVLDPGAREMLAVLLPATGSDGKVQRVAKRRRSPSIPAPTSRCSRSAARRCRRSRFAIPSTVREGQEVLFTGFPIGAVLGPVPGDASRHGRRRSRRSPFRRDARRISTRQSSAGCRSGSFPVFQLDATAYPGNSGSPVYDPATGDVIGIVNMVFVKGTKESALATERHHLRGSVDLPEALLRKRQRRRRARPSST